MSNPGHERSWLTGGCYTVIAFIVGPAKVPAYMGMIGAVFSVVSVAGPLTWWCVYRKSDLAMVVSKILIYFYFNAFA
jgi:MFS transporter, DHA2 family, glioxin efflux transporter